MKCPKKTSSFSKLENIADKLLSEAFYNRIAFENSICHGIYEFEMESSLDRIDKSTEYDLRHAIFYAETMKLTHLPSYETAKTQLKIMDGKD